VIHLSFPEVKIMGSTEATLVIGIILFILGTFFIVCSRKKLIWPISGLMPV
jgi:hypothetical protein